MRRKPSSPTDRKRSRDRAVTFLDDPIGVDELVPELLGEQPTDSRLAGAHEASEHDVARVRGSHGIDEPG